GLGGAPRPRAGRGARQHRPLQHELERIRVEQGLAPLGIEHSQSSIEGSLLAHALEGIKVIDLAINYAGPASSMYLADQGAEVIKVERRIVGDTARRAGNTPFLKLNSRHCMAVNRGTRGMTLDITTPDGAQIVRELVARADVLVENFRPG